MASFRDFLDRPNGGMEVEIIFSAAELWFAIAITWSATAVLNTTTIEDLFWSYSHYYIAIPWWMCSLSTIVGLWLFLRDDPLCAHFRWWGAFFSAVLWFAMFWRGITWVSDPAYLTVVFYFFGALWQPRIMYSAYHRYRLRRSYRG